MHHSTQHVLQFFTFDHLPEPLRTVAKSFADLAGAVAEISDNPETTVALRKLLEAKDAAVRSKVMAMRGYVSPATDPESVPCLRDVEDAARRTRRERAEASSCTQDDQL